MDSNNIDIHVEDLSKENKFIKPQESIWQFRDILQSMSNLNNNNTKAKLVRGEAGFWNEKDGIYGWCGCTGIPGEDKPTPVEQVEDRDVRLILKFNLKEDIRERLELIKFDITPGGRGQKILPLMYKDLGPTQTILKDAYMIPTEEALPLFRKYGERPFRLADYCKEMVQHVDEMSDPTLFLGKSRVPHEIPREGERYILNVIILSIDVGMNMKQLREVLELVNSNV